MSFWDKIICLVSKRRSPACRRRLRLTGRPPSNAAEELVKKIAGGRLEVPLEWLERRICHELYVEELHLTWFTTDIGLCGREQFREEATRVLDGITPEFGYVQDVPGLSGEV